jgi:hypothetical protein
VIVLGPDGRPTEEYRAITDPRDKFKWASEAALIEQSKDEPDFETLNDLLEERHYQRAVATNLFPVWDATHNLSIFDLQGRKILYSPNPVQQELHQIVEAARKAGVPLKLLIPKSRRHGVTEGVSKILYPMIARAENVKGMVVAQAEPEMREIFRDKYSFVHSNDPFAPATRRCNDTMLDFSETGSQIAVRSAGGRKGVGRGSGHIALHLSECAYFPGNPRDVAAMISSLVAGMPKTEIDSDTGEANTVFSCVFAESTGNGQSGWFYEKCMRVHNQDQGRVEGEEGSDESVQGWQLAFFPWQRRWNALLPFENDKHRDLFLASLDEEERLLKEAYNLTPEQLHWRRDTLKNDIEGTTEEERNRMFKQEHPATIIQCFQPAGGMAFPVEAVDRQMQVAKDPVFRGKLVSPISLYNPDTHQYVPGTPLPKIITDNAEGWYHELYPPEEGEEYTVGVDLAKGTIAGDFSTAVVFARHTRKFVAYIQGKLGPDAMVDPVRLLSRRYNNAWINPEENYGSHLIDELKKCDRKQFLYWRKAKSASATHAFDKAFGSNTNKYTKRNFVDYTNHVLENEPSAFTLKPILQEMLTFEQSLSDSGEVTYPGAPDNSGVYDDLIDAAMLALIADRDMKLRNDKGPETEPKEEVGPARGHTRDLRTRLKEMQSAPLEMEEEDEW